MSKNSQPPEKASEPTIIAEQKRVKNTGPATVSSPLKKPLPVKPTNKSDVKVP